MLTGVKEAIHLKINVIYYLWFHEELVSSMEPFHCIVSLLEEKGSLDFLNALHTKNFYFYLLIIYFFKLFTESFFGNQKGFFLQKTHVWNLYF